MTPEAVIFDIGNVLIGWNPEGHYDRRIGEARRRALFAEVDLHGMNEQVDLGAPFQATIYAMAERHPEWRGEIRDWHDSWIEMITPVIDHSVTLLRRLRAKDVPVFALTNFGVDSYAFAQSQFDFLNEFDREFVSGRLRVMKPDPRIYAAVEDSTGVPAARMLFTDDRAENVAAAAARGWQTHLFEGPEGWAARLVDAGLLTQEEAAP
jgi:2-haloacid dehalogenase